MIKHNIEQRSEAWHHIRLGRITGTLFNDLMCKTDLKSYQDLITDIAGEIITEEEETIESYSNAIMERGIELEQEAIQSYENIFDIVLPTALDIQPIVHNPSKKTKLISAAMI